MSMMTVQIFKFLDSSEQKCPNILKRQHLSASSFNIFHPRLPFNINPFFYVIQVSVKYFGLVEKDRDEA